MTLFSLRFLPPGKTQFSGHIPRDEKKLTDGNLKFDSLNIIGKSRFNKDCFRKQYGFNTHLDSPIKVKVFGDLC